MKYFKGRWARRQIQRRWELLKGRLSSSSNQKYQVVVCGYPRSGTSLLYNMLSVSLSGFVFDPFERSALKSIWKCDNHASKQPSDVGVLHRLPSENVHRKRILALVCIRDPRDLIVSVHPNAPKRYYLGFESHWAISGEYPYETTLVDSGIRSISEAVEAAKTVSGLTLRIIRYEDLVQRPDEVQSQLMAAMPLKFGARFSEFHLDQDRHAYRYAGATKAVAPELVRENSPVDASRVGRWRAEQHRQRVREEFETHPGLFELVKAYGYENDDAWFEEYRS